MQRSEGRTIAKDGAEIFTRRWTPDGDVKATVCLLHGVCEHSGRYERVAELLTNGGYAVSAFDLRGHGRSSGRRGDARFAPTLRDIDELLERERARDGTRKLFLYGQSLGGLFVLTYALERQPALAGAVVSAPVLHTALREQRAKVLVARALGRLLPSLSLGAGLDDTKLMRDHDVLADRRGDPLVHDRVTTGFAREALDAADRVLRDAHRLSLPLLVIHGRADQVNFLSGSEALVAQMTGDRTLKVYDDVLHHPHNDPERARIFGDVVAWLDARVTSTARSGTA